MNLPGRLRLLRHCDRHEIDYFFLCADCVVEEIMAIEQRAIASVCRFCHVQEPVYPGHAACEDCEREHGGG